MSDLEQEVESQDDYDVEIEDTNEITKTSPRQVAEKKKTCYVRETSSRI